MQPHQFNGIFYVKNAPVIRFDDEDGMFAICYDVGKVRIEFVMRPSIYQKALTEAQRAFSEFQNRKASVTLLRRRKDPKPAH